MSCYRKGGCGPYEMYSCLECPASKPEYANRYTNQKAVADVNQNFKGVSNMERYINQIVAIDTILENPPDAHYPSWFAAQIANLPAVDVVEVVHGRWVEEEFESYIPAEIDTAGNLVVHKYTHYKCSECGRTEPKKEPYCHCGAKMDR